jgi:hypothetical protein
VEEREAAVQQGQLRSTTAAVPGDEQMAVAQGGPWAGVVEARRVERRLRAAGRGGGEG